VHVLTGNGRDLPQDGFTHAALDYSLEEKADLFLGGRALTAKRVIDWHLYKPRTEEMVRQTLARIQPELVICWNLGMASAAPLVAARKGTAPVVAHPADKWLLYSLSNIGALVPANSLPQRVYVEALRQVAQPILRQIAMPDYILTVSEFIRGLLLDAGYSAAQSAATWLGIDTETFAWRPHPHPGMDRPWRLVYAGQLWAGKGPQVAVEAMRLLRQRTDLPQASLDIYGGGAENFKTWLQEQIEAKGLADIVTLKGHAPQSHLVSAFQQSDLYLFCSIWDEPFSGGLLEALSTGLPTIATTAGGTREAIESGRNGLLVAPEDPVALANAIERMMRQPDLYERMGIQAAVDVRQMWRFEQYIDRLETLYRAIVARHRKGAPIDLQAEAQRVLAQQWSPPPTQQIRTPDREKVPA
jgi:glycosyltransferase involved in cell wall biosynthesis